LKNINELSGAAQRLYLEKLKAYEALIGGFHSGSGATNFVKL